MAKNAGGMTFLKQTNGVPDINFTKNEGNWHFGQASNSGQHRTNVVGVISGASLCWCPTGGIALCVGRTFPSSTAWNSRKSQRHHRFRNRGVDSVPHRCRSCPLCTPPPYSTLLRRHKLRLHPCHTFHTCRPPSRSSGRDRSSDSRRC